jgi:hypothetical protein
MADDDLSREDTVSSGLFTPRQLAGYLRQAAIDSAICLGSLIAAGLMVWLVIAHTAPPPP